MKRSRFSEEQIIGILRESEGPETIRRICAKLNVSEATYYAWKRKYYQTPREFALSTHTELWSGFTLPVLRMTQPKPITVEL
ncbi:transposase [Opitutaceae bacterium]|nr:transposase [Opitutaceae bacterium]MDB4474197.1 transposase [Opitutaceae bacterium]